jgi:hypothetical protein
MLVDIAAIDIHQRELERVASTNLAKIHVLLCCIHRLEIDLAMNPTKYPMMEVLMSRIL